jgi:hypothetical protein
MFIDLIEVEKLTIPGRVEVNPVGGIDVVVEICQERAVLKKPDQS